MGGGAAFISAARGSVKNILVRSSRPAPPARCPKPPPPAPASSPAPKLRADLAPPSRSGPSGSASLSAQISPSHPAHADLLCLTPKPILRYTLPYATTENPQSYINKLGVATRTVKTNLLLFVALTGTLCSSSIAQKARFVGESLLITDGNHRIRLADVIDPDPEYRVVHAVQARGGDYFVVIGVSEMSRGHSAKTGNCAAGIESHIDWLHVRDGKVIERQSGLYESCFQSRSFYSIEWKQGILQWRSEGQRRVEEDGRTTFIPVSYSWAYDPAHPDKGIEEHSEDTNPTNPK